MSGLHSGLQEGNVLPLLRRAWPRLTCERLLAEQPLRLAAQLPDQLARQQADAVDLRPSADSILHEAEPEHVRLLPGPPRGGCEVPQRRGISDARSSLLGHSK